MTCYNKFPIGVPFSEDSIVQREGHRVYIHRKCPLCKEWFRDEVDADSKPKTNNYAEHFTRDPPISPEEFYGGSMKF